MFSLVISKPTGQQLFQILSSLAYTKAEKMSAVAQGQIHLNILYCRKQTNESCCSCSTGLTHCRMERSTLAGLTEFPEEDYWNFKFLCCVSLVVIWNNLFLKAQLCLPSLRCTTKKIPEKESFASCKCVHWFTAFTHLMLNASLRNHSPYFF